MNINPPNKNATMQNKSPCERYQMQVQCGKRKAQEIQQASLLIKKVQLYARRGSQLSLHHS